MPKNRPTTGKWKKVRAFLKSNRTIFEFCGSVLIPLVSLVLSIMALHRTTKQNELQLSASKPIINIETHYNADDVIEECNIYNNGTAAVDVVIEVYPFYDCILYSQDDIQISTAQGIIPIEWIRMPLKITNNHTKTGLLGSICFSEDTLPYLDDMESFKEYADIAVCSDKKLARLSFNYYIRVQYTNTFGDTSTEIFYCHTGASVEYWDSISPDESGLSVIEKDNPDYNMINNLIVDRRIVEEGWSSINGYFRVGETPEAVFNHFVNYVNDKIIASEAKWKCYFSIQ